MTHEDGLAPVSDGEMDRAFLGTLEGRNLVGITGDEDDEYSEEELSALETE